MSYIHNNRSQKELRRNLRKNEPITERLLWSRMRNRQILGLKFRRQYGISNFVLDFYCPLAKLCIEIDGDTHFKDVSAVEKDLSRQKYVENFGIQVLRFTNKEVLENIVGVLEAIYKTLTSPNLSFEKERNKT